jgi:hypothetical protein
MADQAELRPLHLHTVTSLCADLVSGRAIGVGAGNQPFSFTSKVPRAVLNWYRQRQGKWKARVDANDAEAVVDTVAEEPPVLPQPPSRTTDKKPGRLTLVRIEAHRFAGLHAYRRAVSLVMISRYSVH